MSLASIRMTVEPECTGHVLGLVRALLIVVGSICAVVVVVVDDNGTLQRFDWQ